LNTKVPDLYADPFGERPTVCVRRDLHLLGARFQFESNSAELLQLVDSAYAGLPRHRLARATARLRVSLQLTARERQGNSAEPPPLRMLSGAGLLAGATRASNFVVLSPQEKAALVAVSPRMLQFPYHTRYELIEFAVFTLAARVQGLVSLHGACVGHAGRGVLLMGPSGAGKSTVAMLSLLDGLSFLAEDSVFVTPDTLLATGVANFLHVRADSLRWVRRARDQARIIRSRVIQRRSGVRKYEVDLRTGGYPLADRALKLGAIVFLSAKLAGGQPLLTPLTHAEALKRLAREQAYAVNQPPWGSFARNVERLPCFEMRRGQHPGESVAALRKLMSAPFRVTRRVREV
jgi:energy-coupling factor transporter ATP-binding protein EcfA2